MRFDRPQHDPHQRHGQSQGQSHGQSQGRYSPRPRPGRKSRSRLTGLFVALVLVVLAIQLASDPGSWTWLLPSQPKHDTPAVNQKATFQVGNDDTTAEKAIRSETSDTRTKAALSADRLLEGLDLSKIEDDTLGLQLEDKVLIRTLLARLRVLQPGGLERIAGPNPTYPAVMAESEHYRGQVVSLRGLARRVTKLPEEAELPERFALWVFTRDSGINPWRIVAGDIPEDLPLGAHPEGIPIQLSGIFLKRQGYATQQGGVHTAPLVVAASVESLAAPDSAAPAGSRVLGWVLTALVIAGLGVAILHWWQRRGDDRFEHQMIRRLQKSGTDSDEPVVEPEVFLKNLSVPPPEEPDPPEPKP